MEAANKEEDSASANQKEDSVSAELQVNSIPHNHSKKRKRGEGSKRVDHLAKAYENIQFEPRISKSNDIQIPGVDHVVTTTRPGSPSRQFANSYVASFKSINQSNTTPLIYQVVHQHANGLCIVTAGLLDLPGDKAIDKIDFLVSTADPCSANERRKRQSKMLKGKNNSNDSSNSGVVTPTTPLAKLIFQDGTYITLFAFVWGSILELNTNVTPQQLQDDPLLNGYLAVILPTGLFPPKECILADGDGADTGSGMVSTNSYDIPDEGMPEEKL